MDTGQRTAGRFYDMTNPVNTGILQVNTPLQVYHIFSRLQGKRKIFLKNGSKRESPE